MDVLSHLADRVRNPERAPTDVHDRRQVIFIDERDARLRAAVARDGADETRDDQRIDDKQGEQQRRSPEDEQVLAEDEHDAAHTKTSAACTL